MAVLSEKALAGGLSVVSWAREDEDADADDNNAGENLRVEICYLNHRESKPSSEPKTVAFELELEGADSEGQELFPYYVWDTVKEWLDDIDVVEPRVVPAAVDAIMEGVHEMFSRDEHRRSAVLVVSIEVGRNPESVKASLVASGILSLTRKEPSPWSGSYCCAICLDESAREGEVVEMGRLACSHEFHVGCILGWFLKCEEGSPSCPLCRFQLRSGTPAPS